MKTLLKNLIFILLLASVPSLYGQKTQLVLFKDKQGTPFSLQRPEEFLSQRAIERRERQGISLKTTDLPVSPAYLQQIADLGGQVRYTTKWYNGALVHATEEVFAQIQTLPFVERVELIAKQDMGQNPVSATAEVLDLNQPLSMLALTDDWEQEYGAATDQIVMLDLHRMHQEGYRGEGMWIGVFDGGFRQWTNLSVFAGMDIGETYDFVQDKVRVDDSSDHGTRVLSILTSNRRGELVGSAPAAKYFLYKTEDTRLELPIEEAYWLVAAERADSIGIDIIQSSLGYYDFDNSAFDYTHEDLDGKTALVTRAAEWASEVGMVVVTSAGNAGSSAWQKITFPADAPSALSIGAINSLGFIAGFSSFGYTADGRVKPDLVALGSGTATWGVRNELSIGSGTSFSAPLVSGLVAGFWQANPTLTARQVVDFLRRSGHQYRSPDERFGYGIPSFIRAHYWLVNSNEEQPVKDKTRIFPNPIQNQTLHIALDEQWLGKELTIQVCNALGQVVYQQTLEPQTSLQTLELPALAPQLLYMHLASSERKLCFKLLKK
jgi:serine protease AprX